MVDQLARALLWLVSTALAFVLTPDQVVRVVLFLHWCALAIVALVRTLRPDKTRKPPE